MYPQISIDLQKIEFNTRELVSICKKHSIEHIIGVTKVLAGDMKAISKMISSGITHIGDSRISNLKLFQDFEQPKVLLRLPMQSEVEEVVKYADISLNSELATIKLLNESALNQNKLHKIILMFDLGDLREGIWFKNDYISEIEEIMQLNNIILHGIGTNLTCYGGVIPKSDNLGKLIEIKNEIEKTFSIKLEIISGGNSSSLPLLINNEMPEEINNLRLGESILLGRETAYGENITALYQDIFLLHAEIIELKEKPSVPIGEIGVDAFGKKPVFTDQGEIRRAILAIGKQDVDFSNLVPVDENVNILGSSSDHLILDVTKTDYKLGDILSFTINYGGLLQLMTSPYVKKVYTSE